jgi:SAM-dependent methyltransferase
MTISNVYSWREARFRHLQRRAAIGPGDIGEDRPRPDTSPDVSEPHAPLSEPFLALGYVAHEDWAWANYKATILAFADRSRAHAQGRPVRVLEIGGGRDPLFSASEMSRAKLDFTVNDIDAGELALAPPWYRKAHFDIAGDLGETDARLGHYDIIVSRMVFEHIRDAPRAWANCHRLLARDGVALAFFPTLYAPPYVLNLLMPEFLSAMLLRWFFPRRHDSVQPKFPAHYDHCRGGQAALAPMFNAIGFREHLVVPFWSHGYFRRLPVLRALDAFVQELARRYDWRLLTTYAYAVARK